jgi:SAM-dependent methyltransferase
MATVDELPGADGYFDEPVAEGYDTSSEIGGMFAPEVVEPAVDFLAELAGDGPALEFGIGTGRIALPLSARGVSVDGIDLSQAMLKRLATKPGADAIGVVVGDFSVTRAPRAGSYSLVYLVFNTIQNLTTQDAQVDCFANSAAHLRPGGRFVIEVGMPDLRRLPPGEQYVVFDVADHHVGIDEYDVAQQGLVSHHFADGPDGRWERSSGPFRYVWPAEMDLMARMAGLRPRERWSGWKREPFTSESRTIVAVWQKEA